MMTKRAPRAKAATAPVIPEDVSLQKARHLPMFGPGIVITIPLSLWIAYHQELYHLEPTGILEPKVQPKDGPGEAILLVKRIPKEEKQK